jgi:tetratricopeptide (TPR) repeat protein
MNATSCPLPDVLIAMQSGVLPLDAARSAKAHVQTCPLCSMLQRDLCDSPLAEPTLDDVARLRRRIRSRATLRAGKRAHYAAAGLVAAALLIGYFAWWCVHTPPAMTQASRLAEQPRAAEPAKYRLALAMPPLKLPPSTVVVLRGEMQRRDNRYLLELGRALAPYHKGQFDHAERLLDELARRYPRAVEPLFYLGVARLFLGQAREAADALEKAQRVGGGALADDILWYLAVAFERSGGFDRAAPLLAKLCAADGFYWSSACAALDGR